MPKPADKTLPETQVVPNPVTETRSRRKFSTEYKIRIVAEADSCKRGELGHLLRREKLYSNQINQWRKELNEGDYEKLGKSAPGPQAKLTAEQKQIARLEKQLKRLQRELAISNGCIDLQKKALQMLDLNNSEKGCECWPKPADNCRRVD